MNLFTSKFPLSVCCVFCILLMFVFLLLEKRSYEWEQFQIFELYARYPPQEVTANQKTPNTTTTTNLAASTEWPCNRTQRNTSDMNTDYITVSLPGRLGNNMFQYASLLGLARINNKLPYISPIPTLTKTFRISKVKTISLSYVSVIHEKSFGKFDPSLNCLSRGNISLRGYLQSFKYFQNIQDLVRSEFEFLPHVKSSSDQLLRLLFTKNYEHVTKTSTLIGVHVRRGDKLSKNIVDSGERLPSVDYYKNALDFMRKKYTNVQFLVASDDPKWAENNLKAKDVRILPRHEANVHFHVLCSCKHMITSFSSFSWWAGYLAGGDVIYYNQSIAPGSPKSKLFDSNDYFPKQWIGLGD